MGASAPAKKAAPQEIRTFFVSATTWGRRSIFQNGRMTSLFLGMLREHRQKKHFRIHEFVVMHNHFHALLTPGPETSLEKCMQYIKGGFSFRAKRDLGFAGEIWQQGYNEHRVKDVRDYREHVRYIHENPIRARLCEDANDFEYSSANGKYEVDPAPEQFQG